MKRQRTLYDAGVVVRGEAPEDGASVLAPLSSHPHPQLAAQQPHVLLTHHLSPSGGCELRDN